MTSGNLKSAMRLPTRCSTAAVIDDKKSPLCRATSRDVRQARRRRFVSCVAGSRAQRQASRRRRFSAGGCRGARQVEGGGAADL